jgi:hypothetical protein
MFGIVSYLDILLVVLHMGGEDFLDLLIGVGVSSNNFLFLDLLIGAGLDICTSCVEWTFILRA